MKFQCPIITQRPLFFEWLFCMRQGKNSSLPKMVLKGLRNLRWIAFQVPYKQHCNPPRGKLGLWRVKTCTCQRKNKIYMIILIMDQYPQWDDNDGQLSLPPSYPPSISWYYNGFNHWKTTFPSIFWTPSGHFSYYFRSGSHPRHYSFPFQFLISNVLSSSKDLILHDIPMN